MKFVDLKEMTVDELRKKSRELSENLFQAKMKNQMGQLNSPILVQHIRRDMARIKTALNQKLAQ